MNEIVLLIIVALSLFLIYGLQKILNKQGLYYALTILSLIGYIFSFKITTILRMNVNLGIVAVIAMYSCLYLILMKYDNKDIKKIYKITLYSNIILGIFIIIMNYYIPSLTEIISVNIKGTFEHNYKILILYPFIVTLGEYIINKIYGYVTLVQNNIFLTVIVSYIISAVCYIVLFYVLGYIGIMPFRDSLFLGVTTYIIGIVITMINIAFIYLLTRKKVKKWEIFC